MTAILIRTLIVYVCLIATMRLMGKRQIGELEVTDLVTTLLLSEIASLPITTPEIPISHAILPMVILLTLEVLSSWILIRFPALKGLVSARPTAIIRQGKLDQRALRNMRMSVDELMSEIRQQGMTNLSQVECAILEKNGKLTVIPKGDFAPLTAGQAGMKEKSPGLMHIVYSNGRYSAAGLSLIGKDRTWLDKELTRRGLTLDAMFCITANESGELFWIKREDHH